MSIIGWYYLHENGALIYKRELGDTAADIRESTFAKGLWPLDPEDRAGAWRIVVEGLAAGANKERVMELATLWHCNDADADNYANHLGITLGLDGNVWHATPPWFENVQKSSNGFGETKLEALAELCKDLGYQPSKMWGATFADLLKPPSSKAEGADPIEGQAR